MRNLQKKNFVCRYRTQLCNDGTACARHVCFFAHTPEEVRVTPLTKATAAAEKREGLFDVVKSPSPSCYLQLSSKFFQFGYEDLVDKQDELRPCSLLRQIYFWKFCLILICVEGSKTWSRLPWKVRHMRWGKEKT